MGEWSVCGKERSDSMKGMLTAVPPLAALLQQMETELHWVVDRTQVVPSRLEPYSLFGEQQYGAPLEQ
jgi:hypothetical protein